MQIAVDYRNRITTRAAKLQPYVRSFYELYSYIAGEGIYLCCINNVTYELEPGDVIIFRPGTFHTTFKNSKARYERLYINFDVEMERLLKNLDPPVHQFLTDGPVLVHPEGEDQILFTELIRRLSSYEEKSSARVLSGVLDLLCILAHSPIRTTAAVAHGTALIRDIIQYISKNYAFIGGVADIAERFNYSPKHLSARFQAEMGIGLHRFLQDYRLASASAKLLTGISVTACAMECGFDSPSYFINLFKKKYGVTPGKFQEEKIGQN